MNKELIHNLSDDEFLRYVDRSDLVVSNAADRIERLIGSANEADEQLECEIDLKKDRISYLECELEAAKDIAGQLYRSLESVDSE